MIPKPSPGYKSWVVTSTGLPNLSVSALDYNSLLQKIDNFVLYPDYYNNVNYSRFKDIISTYYMSIKGIPSISTAAQDAVAKATNALTLATQNYNDLTGLKISLQGLDFTKLKGISGLDLSKLKGISGLDLSKLTGLMNSYSDITGMVGTLKPRLPSIVNLTAGKRVEGLIRLADNLGTITDLSIFSNLKSLGAAGVFSNLLSLSSLKQQLADLLDVTVKDLPSIIKNKILALYHQLVDSIMRAVKVSVESVTSKFDGIKKRFDTLNVLLNQKTYFASWTEFDVSKFANDLRDKVIHNIPVIGSLAGGVDWLNYGWNLIVNHGPARSGYIPPRTAITGGNGLIGLLKSIGETSKGYMAGGATLGGAINAGIATGAILSQGFSQFATDLFGELNGLKGDFTGVVDEFKKLGNAIPRV